MSDVLVVFLATVFGGGVLMGFVTFGLARAIRSFYVTDVEQLRKRVAELEFILDVSGIAKQFRRDPNATGPLPVATGININVGDATYGELVHGNKSTSTRPS